MRIIVLMILVIMFFQSLYSQSDKQKQEYLSEGEYFLRIEEYREALYYFLLLYRTDTSNANYNFRVGEAYINIPNEETKSIPYLEKAVKDISLEWDRKSINETTAPPHALFYLGNAYRMKDSLELALEKYNQFLEIPYIYLSYNQAIVEEELAATERAKIIKDNPVDLKIELLPPIINSSADQSYPVLNAGENRIMYIEKQKFYDAVMFSIKEDSVWLKPDNITPNVRSDGNLYPTWMSADGTTVLFTKKADNDDIYISTFDGRKWSIAESISDNINTRKDESGASMSSDGKLLFFASNRLGSDGYDIYVSMNEGENKWSKPKPLKSTVNSDGNEFSPYLTPSNNKLFFLSNDHFSMGGLDIFYAVRKGEEEWEAPVNIGYPLNDTKDQMYFFPVSDSVIYISKWPDNISGNRDIYRITIKNPEERNFFIPEKVR